MTAILSRTGGHQGVALAVPMEAVRAAVERIVQGGGRVRRPSLGLRVRELATRVGAASGLLVTGFDDASLSQGGGGGLAAGDVLLVAAGRPLRRPADLQRVIWGHKPGDLILLVVQRGTRRFDLRVRLR
jgi:S1-C subfamily serine protease